MEPVSYTHLMISSLSDTRNPNIFLIIKKVIVIVIAVQIPTDKTPVNCLINKSNPCLLYTSFL